jgi:hypothetical protein
MALEYRSSVRIRRPLAIQAYTKELGKRQTHRIERVETPRKELADPSREKLERPAYQDGSASATKASGRRDLVGDPGIGPNSRENAGGRDGRLVKDDYEYTMSP